LGAGPGPPEGAEEVAIAPKEDGDPALPAPLPPGLLAGPPSPTVTEIGADTFAKVPVRT
jgi:hypothetical protein